MQYAEDLQKQSKNFENLEMKIKECFDYVANIKNANVEEINSLVQESHDKMRTEFMSHHSPDNLVDYKTFNEFLKGKVDKDEFENSLQDKSNLQDVERNLNAISTIHKQLKNVGVLVFEILRRELMKYEEKAKTKNGGKREALEILDQASNVVKWIDNFKIKTEEKVKEISISVRV